jgi:hypothetical protein
MTQINPQNKPANMSVRSKVARGQMHIAMKNRQIAMKDKRKIIIAGKLLAQNDLRYAVGS